MSASGIQLSVPSAGEAIDWEHLDRATLGDAKLAAEVLALFHTQAGEVADSIRDLPPQTGRLVHGIKGSARGIGAVRVAEAAQALERVLADSAAAAPAVAELIAAIGDARSLIAERLRKPDLLAPRAGAPGTEPV